MKYPNIEAERARNGMSKAELAEKLNVSNATLNNWQNGTTELPIRKLVELSDLFHVSSDYLVGRVKV